MSNRELEDFTNASLARWERPTEDDDLDVVDEQEPEQEAEGAEQVDAEALPAGWDEFVASLTLDEAERAAGSPLYAEEQFARWQAANAEQTGAETEPDARAPRTGPELTDWIMSHGEEIQADFQMTPDAYLAWVSSMSRAEFRKFAAETGVGPDSKPGYSHLSPSSQSARIRGDLAKMTKADWERLGK